MSDYEDRVDGLNLKVVGLVDHIKTPPTVSIMESGDRKFREPIPSLTNPKAFSLA